MLAIEQRRSGSTSGHDRISSRGTGSRTRSTSRTSSWREMASSGEPHWDAVAATLLSLDLPRGSHPGVRPTVTRAITRRATGSRPVVSSSSREHGARSGGARSTGRVFRARFALRRRGVRRSSRLGASACAPRESPALCAPGCTRGGSSRFRLSPRPLRPRSNSRDTSPGNAGPGASIPSRSAACVAGSRRSCGSAETQVAGARSPRRSTCGACEDQRNGALARGQGSSSAGLGEPNCARLPSAGARSVRGPRTAFRGRTRRAATRGVRWALLRRARHSPPRPPGR